MIYNCLLYEPVIRLYLYIFDENNIIVFNFTPIYSVDMSRIVDLYELSMPSLLYRIKSITSRDAVKPDFPVGLSRSTVNFDTGADLLARYFKHIID